MRKEAMSRWPLPYMYRIGGKVEMGFLCHTECEWYEPNGGCEQRNGVACEKPEARREALEGLMRKSKAMLKRLEEEA